MQSFIKPKKLSFFFIFQIEKLEEGCKGLLSYKTNWISVTQQDISSIKRLNIPLFNFLVVQLPLNNRQNGRPIIFTLTKHQEFKLVAGLETTGIRVKQTLYPNKLCGFCLKHFKVVTIPVRT